MLLDCVDLAVVALQRVWEEGGAGAGTGGGCPLELLPMEFAELNEVRRVADLAACASWRAKEKSCARMRAKLMAGANNKGGDAPMGQKS